jgi:NADH-ubiquinone oxidoreductase chain 2
MGYSSVYNGGVTCGLLLIGIGFLFKVAAAPLHNWAPDVYDGVPTIVTSWLTTMPKISIFVFLLELQSGLEGSFESLSLLLGDDSSINIWKNLLLIASILSLIIGTVVGLSQYRIKRLLAYSTISHVGFLLLALAINTEESIESFLFYLIQYSLTNVNTFLILLAFGYILSTSKSYLLANRTSNKQSINTTDIQFIDQLKGQFKENPLLGLSLALCLFSMAGIPPLIGFFAKQMVLYSSTHGGYYFLSIIAILVSVISASYYLKIIRVIYFDTQDTSNDIVNTNTTEDLKENTTLPKITNVHSLLISSLTMIILLFVLQPSILLNSCHILALSLFYY